ELLQLDTRQDAPAVLHQAGKEIELIGGEVDGRTLDGDAARTGLEPDVADGHRAVLARAGRAWGARVDRCDELDERERLHEIVVRAGAQAGDAVLDRVA